MIGKSVSHNRIPESLGSGGMGAVHKAAKHPLGRPMDLKSQLSAARERNRSRAYASRPNSGSDVGLASSGCGRR
jgi:hypothetical protein